MIILVEIAGIGDATNGVWRFCSAVPSYGGDECKPWLAAWPMPSRTEVDLETGGLRIPDVVLEISDGSVINPGAISAITGVRAAPIAFLSEDISKTDTAFAVTKQAASSSGDLLWVGSEAMLRGADSGGDITVTRARLSTSAEQWLAGTPVFAVNPSIGGAKVRLLKSPESATSTGDEVLIGEYSVDSVTLEDGVLWRIECSSSLALLNRSVCTGVAPESILTGLKESILTFIPTGQAKSEGNPYSREASLWSEGAYILIDKEAVHVDTHESVFSLTVLGRGKAGTEQSSTDGGEPIRPCLVADYGAFSSFRYSSTNSTTRASGWTASTHWVDILLCLMTSPASTRDGLELTNGDATHGNWSCLATGWGIGIPVSRINLASFASVKARTQGQSLDGFVLHPDKVPFSKIALEILALSGAVIRLDADSKLELVLPQPAFRDVTYAEATETEIVTRPRVNLEAMRPSIAAQVMARGYLGGSHVEAIGSDAIPEAVRGYVVDSDTIKVEVPFAATGIPGWIRRRAAYRVILRARPEWMVSFDAVTELDVLPGDLVEVTCSGLPAMEGGTLGWTAEPVRVTSVQESTGEEPVKAISGQSERGRTGRIAPCAVITSVASLVATVSANVFSSGDEADLAADDAGSFDVGDEVSLRYLDLSVVSADTATITTISGNDITLDGNLGGNLAADRILVLATRSAATADAQDRYAWVADDANMDVATGVDPDVWGEA